jgi:AraC-like DNA-binding protein
MGLVLTPWAVPALFGMPASILREQHIDLEELLGDDSLRIEACFAEGKSGLAMEELQAALLRRLQPKRLPDRALGEAIRALSSGSTPVATIATRVGWSERHLRDRVYQSTGLSPRELSRIARLQRLLKQVEREDIPWSEHALRGGFADQAHLCREFKALTGLTPTEYRPTPGAPNHVPLRNVQDGRSLPGDKGA